MVAGDVFLSIYFLRPSSAPIRSPRTADAEKRRDLVLLDQPPVRGAILHGKQDSRRNMRYTEASLSHTVTHAMPRASPLETSVR